MTIIYISVIVDIFRVPNIDYTLPSNSLDIALQYCVLRFIITICYYIDILLLICLFQCIYI